MANIVDIIQRILIAGDREVTATFKRVSDAGEAAFNTIGTAVEKIGGPFKHFEADLDNVEKKAHTFGGAISDTFTSFGSFAERLTVVGAAVGAVGGKFLTSTLSISTALKSVSAAMKEQALAGRQHANEAKQQIETDFSQANALQDLARRFREQVRGINDTRNAEEDLDRQLTKGTINRKQYADQLEELQFQKARQLRGAFEQKQREQKQLEEDQARQKQQAAELRAEKEDIRKEEAADAAAAEKRGIQLKLEAQFGGALASTLVNLANVLDTVRNRFLSTFGPQIADFLTKVVNAVRDAAPAIFEQFERISKALDAALSGSGATINDVISNGVKFAGDLANAFITIVVPAAQAFFKVLQNIAAIINDIFGTNFTAGGIIAAAIVLKLSGLFGILANGVKLLVGGVRLLFAAFGPVGIVVGIIVALILTELIPVLAKIDWKAVGDKAVEIWNTIKKTIADAAETIRTKWNDTFAWFGDRLNDLANFWQKVIDKVRAYLGLAKSDSENFTPGQFPLNDVEGFAGGGLFRGRGGIDRNLIAVTDKEYIINPRAVRHFGVGFFDMLNAMVNPLRGFANGGFTGLSTPVPQVRFAHATGASRASARPLTLVIGDQMFEGLTVQDDTAENMGRYAARRGVRAAGRRPMWFGGTR